MISWQTAVVHLTYIIQNMSRFTSASAENLHPLPTPTPKRFSKVMNLLSLRGSLHLVQTTEETEKRTTTVNIKMMQISSMPFALSRDCVESSPTSRTKNQRHARTNTHGNMECRFCCRRRHPTCLWSGCPLTSSVSVLGERTGPEGGV